MRLTREARREDRSISVGSSADAYTGETRETLIARARAGGWDVIGHRWIRMSRGPISIDIWFTDVTGRVVRARRCSADGQVEELDIVHQRQYRTTLAEVVSQWLSTPYPEHDRPRRASRSRSAETSTEFEAIGLPSAKRLTRPGHSAQPAGRVHVPAWVRTDLSPA